MRILLVIITCFVALGCSDDDNGTTTPSLENAVKHMCDCAETDYCSQCTDPSHSDCAVCKDRQTCESLMAADVAKNETCYTCILKTSCKELLKEGDQAPCKNECPSPVADGGPQSDMS